MLGRKKARTKRWQRRTLLKKHRGICALCGEQVVLHPDDHPRRATIDHIVPLSQGGADMIKNMQLACLECNLSKGQGAELPGDDS